jgi:excisionase family DNA binding protein
VNMDGLVTCGEAARRLGVSPPTLRKRIRRGELEVFEDPLNDRKRLIRVTDLEPLRQPRPVRREELAEISAA